MTNPRSYSILSNISLEIGSKVKLGMKQNISSALTFFYKIIWPVLWTLAFIYFSLKQQVLFNVFAAALLLWLPGIAYYYFLMMPLKRVAYDERSLYISNYFNEVELPLSSIREIKEIVSPWNMPRYLVWLTLKSDPGFDKRIKFVPKFPIKETVKDLKRAMSGHRK